MSDRVADVPQVEHVLDVFPLTQITGSDGMMLVETVVDELPTNAEKTALREKLEANPMIMGNVLANTAMAIIGVLKAVSRTDRRRLRAADRRDEVGVDDAGGFPDIRTRVGEDIRGDMRTFVPLGLGIILVFLWACFRQVQGVLPFAVVVMSTVVAMGLIPLFGWKVQMVTVVLPVILLAVANDYGIHLMAKYQEDNQPDAGFDGPTLARRAMRDLGAPVIAAAFTTMAGLLCLNTHIIVPAAQLGVLAHRVFFALVGSLCFIPAVFTGHEQILVSSGATSWGRSRASSPRRDVGRSAARGVHRPRRGVARRLYGYPTDQRRHEPHQLLPRGRSRRGDERSDRQTLWWLDRAGCAGPGRHR